MTLQNFRPQLQWPFPNQLGFLSIANQVRIDAADEALACISRIRKSGTVTHVCFWCHSVPAGSDIEGRIEGVDGAGAPSGSLAYTSANGALTVSTSGWKEIPINSGSGVAVTRGDLVARIVKQPNASPGDLYIGGSYYVTPSGFSGEQYFDHWYSSAWGHRFSNVISIKLKYDDGTYEPDIGWYMASSFNGYYINSGSTPDEVGNVFSLPFPCRVSGLWVSYEAAQPATVTLYDASNNVLRTVSHDADQDYATIAYPMFFWFDDDVDLAASTDYRWAIKPDGVSDGVMCYAAYFASEAHKKSAQEFFSLTTRTNAGAWTDDTAKLAIGGLIFTGFADDTSGGGGGGGGGLLTHPGMAGGMRG